MSASPRTLVFGALLAASALATPAHADPAMPQELTDALAGKYKGTKFACDLTGDTAPAKGSGIQLDGFCRVGVFKQPMSALITKAGGTYKGKFLDGASGKGLDITSGTERPISGPGEDHGTHLIVAIGKNGRPLQCLHHVVVERVQLFRAVDADGGDVPIDAQFDMAVTCLNHGVSAPVFPAGRDLRPSS